MNFYDAIETKLINNGLSKEMSEEVMKIIINHEIFDGTMKGRWGDDVNEYPMMLLNVTWLTIKPIVLKYLEEHAPKAWFKPVFMNDEDRDKYLNS